MDLSHLYGATPAAAALSSALSAIDDPSDWPAQPAWSASAAALDSHLRCAMCQELFTSPVLLAGCHHTFCSLCIRSRIATAGANTCPTCRRECQERELIANRLVDDIVVAFREARQGLLKATLRFVQQQDHPNGSGSTRGQKASAAMSMTSGREHTGDQDTGGLRRSTRARKPVVQATSSSSSAATQEEGDEDDGLDDRPSKRQRITGGDDDADYISDPNGDDDDDIIMIETSSSLSASSSTSSAMSATCPICAASGIHPDALAIHVNACLDQQETPSSTTFSCSPPAPPPTRPRPSAPAALQPIPAPATSTSSSSSSSHAQSTSRGLIPTAKLPRIFYHHHKDAHLRALLKDHKLPTTGTRTQLMDRHRAWVRMWNASLDAREERRPLVVELRDRLMREERAREIAAAASADGAARDPAGSVGGAGGGVVDALVRAAAGSIGRRVPGADDKQVAVAGGEEDGSVAGASGVGLGD